jgi:hypothetical protein
MTSRMSGTSRVRRALAVVTLVMVLLVPVGSAVALDLSEWVQGLRVAPFISERFEYESNVFQTPSHSKDDLIFKTIPGVLVEYGTGPHWISLGYRAEILNFLDMSNQNAVHHIFLGQTHFEFNRLTLNIRDNFIRTTDPPGTELVGRIESTTNTLAPDAEYRLTDRFSIGANATWVHVSFPVLPQLDRDEYLFGGSVFWKFQPKTDLRLTYNYGVKEFNSDANRDVTRHVILLGIRGELTSKLSSTFRIGYEDREPNGSGPGPQAKAYRGIVGGGDWVYQPTERLRITLLTDRSVQESIFANELFFLSTMGTLAVEQRVGPKVSVTARLTGGENAYPTKSQVGDNTPFKFRNDMILGWGAGVGYDVQPWLRLALDFLHTDRDSNFRAFSFKDDKLSAMITFQF